MDALLTAIISRTAGSTLNTLVGGRLYAEEAPARTAYPYVVFHAIGRPEYTFTEIYEVYTVQFTMYSSSSGLTEITGVYDAVKALFDDAPLTVTGYRTVWCRREDTAMLPPIKITTPSGTEMARCWTVDYEIKISLN